MSKHENKLVQKFRAKTRSAGARRQRSREGDWRSKASPKETPVRESISIPYSSIAWATPNSSTGPRGKRLPAHPACPFGQKAKFRGDRACLLQSQSRHLSFYEVHALVTINSMIFG